MVSVFPALLFIVLAVAGAAQAARFDVASVKPNHAPPILSPSFAGGFFPGDTVRFTNAELFMIIKYGYGLELTGRNTQLEVPSQFAALMGSRYDIEGRGGVGTPAEKLRALLRERFGLRMHEESRRVPVYEVTAQSSHLTPSPYNCFLVMNGRPADEQLAPPGVCGALQRNEEGRVRYRAAGTIDDLIRYVALGRLRLPVINKTNMPGTYTWDLTVRMTKDAADDAPLVIEALEQQLGLKFTQVEGPWTVWVLDEIHEPTPN